MSIFGKHPNIQDLWDKSLVGGAHITTTGVAVDPDYFWRAMRTCPRSAKVQLLNKGGVAIYGTFNGELDLKNPEWLGWAPLPKKPVKDMT
jgi:hypothetical protein